MNVKEMLMCGYGPNEEFSNYGILNADRPYF